MEHQISQTIRFNAEVRERFGVLPNFFCTAPSAPGLIEKMWGFAKSGYLDNPLPSLFKERLFVHLSRFCGIRYCIVRHVGFLIGEGRPAGDAAVVPHTIEQVLELLKKARSRCGEARASARTLETAATGRCHARGGNDAGRRSFDALTILFVAPQRAERARKAIMAAIGEMKFELLTAFLAFVRTAHYWTERIRRSIEADMIAVMKRYPELADLMLMPDAQWAQSGEALRCALADLRNTAGTLRATEIGFEHS